MTAATLPLYQVDAFTERVFGGNPAAVCPLDGWLDDTTLQAIAAENNLSETAFFIRSADGFELRWLTPVDEVDLCGHATLAAAHVLFDHLGHAGDEITFSSRSGPLTVRRVASGYRMDFPAAKLEAVDPVAAVRAALGGAPTAILGAYDYLAVYETEAEVRALEPDFRALARLDRRGVIATARGDEHDFVSRCFFPKLGVDEDPVTGSAHCVMAPYWSRVLGRDRLRARQCSERGGEVGCEVVGDRILLTGAAVTYMVGEIRIDR